jgi:hypothetical protein
MVVTDGMGVTDGTAMPDGIATLGRTKARVAGPVRILLV